MEQAALIPKAVPDYDDASPHSSWIFKIPIVKIEAAFKQANRDPGQLLNLSVISRSPSARALTILVCGADRAFLSSGEEVRHLLQLPSSVFNVGLDQGTYVFAGRGFGHGLGMSQWGARALALEGYTAQQILKYYYKDVVVDSFDHFAGYH